MGLLEDLKTLQQQAERDIAEVASADQLEQFRIKYLGSKGATKTVMTRLKEVPREDKPAAGKLANEVKNAVTALFEQAKASLSDASGPAGPVVDVTLPGRRPRIGRPHILTQTINEITDVLGRMGFEVAYGPEVEDEWHNFVALNIPASHPARDELENFYITPGVLLRSMTSTIQARVMEKTPPPLRVTAVGRCYRPDTVDATHHFMFHQVEGLYVDEGVSMADLITCLSQFCEGYFGKAMKTRLRPSFFPFTEPSAELDMLFEKPDGTTQWIEIGGCGMVDPNVLTACGIDPEKYTGFAFGLGIERLAMRKHGVTDIRLFTENDLRFLGQF